MSTRAPTRGHSRLARKPQAASSITPISNSFTQRVRRDFSSLSAIWPLVAENRKNGRMNRPGEQGDQGLGAEGGELARPGR